MTKEKSQLFPIYIYKIEEVDLSKIDVEDGEGVCDAATKALMRNANDAGLRRWEFVDCKQDEENPTICTVTYKKPSFF